MNLGETIKEIARDKNNEVYSVVCRVNLIDLETRTCDVTPLNGDADLFGVRLQSEFKDDKGLLLVPKKDSTVVVTFLNRTTGYVALCSEVEKFEFSIGQKVLEFDKDGLRVSGSQTDLLSEVNALADQITGIYDFLQTQYFLVTPTGPTAAVLPSVPPIVTAKKAAINQIKTRIKDVLK